MKNYRRGIELLALSYGWDIANKQQIKNPDSNQIWRSYLIRLYKAALSCQLFGEHEYFDSLRKFTIEVVPKQELDKLIMELFDI